MNLGQIQGGAMTDYQGRDAVIVGAVRTPVGKGKAGGALHDVLPAGYANGKPVDQLLDRLTQSGARK
jgi:acetyl-CoA acetyltransferase